MNSLRENAGIKKTKCLLWINSIFYSKGEYCAISTETFWISELRSYFFINIFASAIWNFKVDEYEYIVNNYKTFVSDIVFNFICSERTWVKVSKILLRICMENFIIPCFIVLLNKMLCKTVVAVASSSVVFEFSGAMDVHICLTCSIHPNFLLKLISRSSKWFKV